MTSASKVVFEIPLASRAASRRDRWQLLRDLLGGALLLAVWLTLWTVTWAAVAGPLSPVEPARQRSAAVQQGA